MQSGVCKSILIVEDEHSIREILQLLLETEGYPVVCAENGRDALTQLERLDHPCLILCDLMMPVMNGWDFIAEMKKDKLHGFAVIPIVVVSAAGDHAVATRGPVDGYIKKPFELNLLLKVVQHYCGAPSKGEPLT